MRDFCGTCGAYWDCDCQQKGGEVPVKMPLKIETFALPEMEYKPWEKVPPPHPGTKKAIDFIKEAAIKRGHTEAEAELLARIAESEASIPFPPPSRVPPGARLPPR